MGFFGNLGLKKKKENADCMECFAEKDISKTENGQRVENEN